MALGIDNLNPEDTVRDRGVFGERGFVDTSIGCDYDLVGDFSQRFDQGSDTRARRSAYTADANSHGSRL